MSDFNAVGTIVSYEVYYFVPADRITDAVQGEWWRNSYGLGCPTDSPSLLDEAQHLANRLKARLNVETKIVKVTAVREVVE